MLRDFIDTGYYHGMFGFVGRDGKLRPSKYSFTELPLQRERMEVMTGEKCQKRFEFEVAAIQKQMPKKPINIETKISMASCPVCCYEFPDIGGYDDPCGEVEKYDYCPNCGQRIDWSWAK